MASLIDELTASVDPVAVMRRVAEQTCLLVTAADGAAVSLRDHDDLVVLSAHGVLEPLLGRVVPAAGTFTAYALHSGRPEICHEIGADERLTPDVSAVGIGLGVRSCVTIPLLRGGTAIGAVSAVGYRSQAFGDDDVACLASMSGFISTIITANTELAALVQGVLGNVSAQHGTSPAARFLASLVAPELAERDLLRAEVESLAGPGRLSAVFQPIVDLADRRIHGVEGLCRFPGNPPRGPAGWFTTAHRVGRGVDLELSALATVLDAARGLPASCPIGVNLSPAAALHPTAQGMLLSADRDLVLELTAHEPAPDPLGSGLEALREAGVMLAVDDAGAGFASLTQILRLRPDVLKLDRELTAGIETDPVRRALATALVRFAEELGAWTVAEGIESEEQYDVLRDLGIGFGQGYWLGRPQPAADLLPLLGDDRPRFRPLPVRGR